MPQQLVRLVSFVSLSLSLALSRSLTLSLFHSRPSPCPHPLSLEQKDLMPQQLVKKVQLTVTEVRCEFKYESVLCFFGSGFMVQALFIIVLHDIVM
jgi:hypothetical protein